MLKLSSLKPSKYTRWILASIGRLVTITFFQNCTTYMIMAQDNKFQEIFIINVLELIMVKKMLQYVGPDA